MFLNGNSRVKRCEEALYVSAACCCCGIEATGEWHLHHTKIVYIYVYVVHINTYTHIHTCNEIKKKKLGVGVRRFYCIAAQRIGKIHLFVVIKDTGNSISSDGHCGGGGVGNAQFRVYGVFLLFVRSYMWWCGSHHWVYCIYSTFYLMLGVRVGVLHTQYVCLFALCGYGDARGC